MLRYRAATFFQRQFCPEIGMGLNTKEEVEDIGYVEEVKTTVHVPAQIAPVDEDQVFVDSMTAWEDCELAISNNHGNDKLIAMLKEKQNSFKQ